jgi:hypothetical protein
MDTSNYNKNKTNFNMITKEITIDIDKIESVDVSQELDLNTKIQMCWVNNQRKIICLTLLLIIVFATIGILLSGTKVTQTYCDKYTSDSFTSEVSVKCLQEIWTNTGCTSRGTPPIPDNYVGWWLQSPQGTKLIPCTKTIKDFNCGAGSFQNIVTYSYICKIEGLIY